MVDAGGTQLRLAVVAEVPAAGGTSAGWLVDDVNTAAAARRRVASVGQSPGMDQDADGVWRPPGGGGVVWFHDPDGNRLSLTRGLDPRNERLQRAASRSTSPRRTVTAGPGRNTRSPSSRQCRVPPRADAWYATSSGVPSFSARRA